MNEKYLKNWQVFPGFELELIASGFSLPVNLAFIPKPGKKPKDPLFYVTELYGQIKVVCNDFSVKTFAKDLLNYKPDYQFPGSGESGVTGICVEPESGDLFVSMIYLEKEQMKNKVVRISSKNGLVADSMVTIIDNILSVHAAHQVQAVSIGFDQKLYVNIGDGMALPNPAQKDDDLRGKILRLNLDGTIPGDNPRPKSPVFAKGFRNPFGAFWRKSNRSLYVTDNGPNSDDRIAKVKAGKNYGWPKTMQQNSIFWWGFTQAPTALAFAEDGQFPPQYKDQLFLNLYGGAYQVGRAVKGKKMIKIQLSDDDSGIKSYDEFVTYVGNGAASLCGLSFGPGGLYFSDLFGDDEATGNKSKGNIYRVKAKDIKGGK